ncbi:uncharacterized protein LOC130590811 [Beta vulgaris subsp. vulgaris]|uniref:uncharacterized protein LOC130590811 n=1 Tax=Beta vulgaris subsp. vulgaris TaxID=3555 RepID=UPI0025488635|nr:uncharacterized protein LOC130590811 [Beta vulgaris subsp. vulgaris]
MSNPKGRGGRDGLGGSQGRGQLIPRELFESPGAPENPNLGSETHRDDSQARDIGERVPEMPSSQREEAEGSNRASKMVLSPTGLWFDDNKVSGSITDIFQGHFREPWFNYSEVDDATKTHWWNSFTETYNKKLDDCSTQGSQPNPDLLYWETVGGRNRGKVQGLGQGDHLYYNSSSGRGGDGSSQLYEPSMFSQLEAQVEAKVAARMVEVEAKVAARLEESNRSLVQEMMRNMTNFGHLFSGCNTGPSPQRRPEDDPGFGGGGTSATETPATV